MNKTILVCAVSSCLMAFANAAEYKLSTDVLVIGAGSAGLTAAVQSAEKERKSSCWKRILWLAAVLNSLKVFLPSNPN